MQKITAFLLVIFVSPCPFKMYRILTDRLQHPDDAYSGVLEKKDTEIETVIFNSVT